MDKKEWIGVSITVLLVALVGVGYNITNQTYFCESRGLVMECSRFSSSGLRCYPSLTSTAGYRDCKNGWIKVEGEVVVPQEPRQYHQVTKYLCNNKECEEIV